MSRCSRGIYFGSPSSVLASSYPSSPVSHRHLLSHRIDRLAISSEFWESGSGASSALLIIFLLALALPSAADACPVIGYSASSLSSVPWLHSAYTKAETPLSSSPSELPACPSFCLFFPFPLLSLLSRYSYAAYPTIECGSR